MNKPLSELLVCLRHNQNDMVAQLHQFCEINSGSEHLHGLQTMHDALRHAFSPLADHIESISFPPMPHINMAGETHLQSYGNALFIRKRPHLTRRILLCGHMDTVYAKDHPFQSLNYLDPLCLQGPGVADMKGGLVVIQQALSAFEQTTDANSLGWDVFINADEEIGSLASSSWLYQKTSDYQAGLVYEPSMTPEGTFAKNRKGSGKLTLIATGKAAHAGRAFDEGRNAICYLAEALVAIQALNGQRVGVTINVGKIAGGVALNVVPDKAVAKLDVRINDPTDEIWVRQHMDAIIHQLQRPGHTLTLHGHFARPVKRINATTERLFKRIQHLGLSLGLTLNWQDSGGCCDGNNLAHAGLPVIDTLGVRGGKIHSADEFILIDSLTERAALSTLLLVDLAQKGLEELQI